MKTTSQKIRTGFISAAAFLFAVPFTAQAISEVPLHNPDNPWSVLYLGSSYDGVNTTFQYQVTVDGDPDLSHFNIEAPVGCELTLVSGPDPAGKDGSAPDKYDGVQWFKWDQGQGDGTKTYSLVLAGNVGGVTGMVVVKAGQYFAVGDALVPSCNEPGPPEPPPVYSISGTVFMDANRNGLDDGEPGLSNVTVDLLDGDGNVVASLQTSESGDYVFTDLLAGDYRVIVVPENDILDDFNEVLADYFLATTDTHINLPGLAEDAVDNDFGFVPDPVSIIDEFNPDDPDGNGVIFHGNGKTIGFWKHQNAVADKGKGRAQVDAATLQGYIDAIEELLLHEPFQFDDANEFRAAHDVLAIRSSDALDLLKKQLLGSEFNDVAGRGLEAPFDELQDKLIAWGEHLAANSDLFTRDELIDAKDIFDLINNTGNR
jgi:hypothetical protein